MGMEKKQSHDNTMLLVDIGTLLVITSVFQKMD